MYTSKCKTFSTCLSINRNLNKKVNSPFSRVLDHLLDVVSSFLVFMLVILACTNIFSHTCFRAFIKLKIGPILDMTKSPVSTDTH